jgi:starch phosphorylase
MRDSERLASMLNQANRPVQLLIAGKAHPRDNTGKELIKRVVQFARRKDVVNRVVFLEDYEIGLAHDLVQGVDVWLNNPIKRLEASGTSGMKVTPNGGINLSVLDGWWPEGYDGTNGWAIGNNHQYDNDEYQDFVDSEALYDLLEREIVPLFYERGADGLPRGWIAKMKNSMRTCSPKFSANRMVREYTERMYVPAAKRWQQLTADGFSAARALTAWKSRLASRWDHVRIEAFGADGVAGGEAVHNESATQPATADLRHEESATHPGGSARWNGSGIELEVGKSLDVTARVRLGDVSPDEVVVELYYGPAAASGGLSRGASIPMQCRGHLENGVYEYGGSVPCARSGMQGFTVRVIPRHPEFVGRYDLPLIRWA